MGADIQQCPVHYFDFHTVVLRSCHVFSCSFRRRDASKIIRIYIGVCDGSLCILFHIALGAIRAHSLSDTYETLLFAVLALELLILLACRKDIILRGIAMTFAGHWLWWRI